MVVVEKNWDLEDFYQGLSFSSIKRYVSDMNLVSWI